VKYNYAKRLQKKSKKLLNRCDSPIKNFIHNDSAKQFKS
jgi:hypothetical protein